MKSRKEGRWARKRRLRREREQAGPKVDSYRKTARLRLQEMFRAGFGNKRSSDKTNADTRNKIYSKNTLKRINVNSDTLLIGSQKPIKRFIRSLTRQYVDEYLLHLVELERSAYSITTAKLRLPKSLQTEATHSLIPPRSANIKRPGVFAVHE